MKRIAIFAGLLFAAPAFGQENNNGFPVRWVAAATDAPALPVVDGEPIPDGATLIWHDEFSALSVTPSDGAGPWYAPVHYQLGLGKLAVPPDPAISVDQGYLVLQTRETDGAWTDTNIQTTNNAGIGFTIQNGYIDVRALPSQGYGSHNGIWLLSAADPIKGHAEIDILESYGPADAAIHQTVHLWPGEDSTYPTHVSDGFYIGKALVPTLLDQAHNFGILLTPTQITLFYDGKPTSSIPRLPDQQVPFYILLSNFTDANRKDGYSLSEMRVDYVRVYSIGP